MTVKINGQPKPARLILPPDDLWWKLAARRHELRAYEHAHRAPGQGVAA